MKDIYKITNILAITLLFCTVVIVGTINWLANAPQMSNEDHKYLTNYHQYTIAPLYAAKFYRATASGGLKLDR